MLALFTAVTAFRMRTVDPKGDALYERCKDMPGVRVGSIHDFTVNDTMSVDVTTFEALDAEGWQQLVEVFGIQDRVTQGIHLDSIASANMFHPQKEGNTYQMWKTAPYRPELNGDRLPADCDLPCDLVFMSLYYRWVAVYHIEREEQYDNVIDHYMLKVINKASMATPTEPGEVAAR